MQLHKDMKLMQFFIEERLKIALYGLQFYILYVSKQPSETRANLYTCFYALNKSLRRN
jgi:hypothetical protein